MNEYPIRAALAAEIRARAARAGLDQRDICLRTGIAYSTMSRYYRALTDIPIDALDKIAAVFGVSIPDLLAAAISTRWYFADTFANLDPTPPADERCVAA